MTPDQKKDLVEIAELIIQTSERFERLLDKWMIEETPMESMCALASAFQCSRCSPAHLCSFCPRREVSKKVL